MWLWASQPLASSDLQNAKSALAVLHCASDACAVVTSSKAIRFPFFLKYKGCLSFINMNPSGIA